MRGETPDTPAISADPEHSFLSGGGEMGALMRAHDWSRSPLGPPEGWAQSLRTVVGLMLNSKFPMFATWGQELAFLYNDGYTPILGAKHPAAVGEPFQNVWSDIWSDIKPLIDKALAGEATFHENLPLIVLRDGYEEQTYFTFSYSPVRDDAGNICGMFCACQETTAEVKARSALNADREHLRELFEQAPSFMAVVRGPTHVFELSNSAYLELVGRRDLVGRTVQEALPDVEGQGFVDLLNNVYRSGEPFVGRGAPVVMERVAGSAPETRYVDFVYQPIRDASGAVTGIFVDGSDVTDAKRSEEHLRLLVNELNHRVKNTLATVQSIAAHSLRNSASPAEFRTMLDARLVALSKAHDLLTRTHWEGASLSAVLAQETNPYQTEDSARIALAGDDVDLAPRAALTLAMAFHELATNAAKYGALSVPSGRIDVRWLVEPRLDEPSMLRLTWTERDGPEVKPPSRNGFGSRLIERGIVHELVD